ncbi:DUF1761 domain-containing protein [Candidatus Saccharibacteria bacterium]|nr:MAG: DUF1761 domain-containing protein [Candidatus Saccharibacteria bacterium]
MDIDVKLSAVLVAAVAQFAVGAIWYMPLFGKLWGKIHGFDALDKKRSLKCKNKWYHC